MGIRRKPPPLITTPTIGLMKPIMQTLSNGAQFIALDVPMLKIAKLEILFPGGRLKEDKNFACRATTRLMREATTTMQNQALNNFFDDRGADLDCNYSIDSVDASIYGQLKDFPPIIEVLNEVIQTPTFPARETRIFFNNTIEKIKANRSDLEVRSYQLLTEQLFGASHPYGYNTTTEDVRSIKQEDMVHFHEAAIKQNGAVIIYCGHLTPAILKAVETNLGKTKLHASPLVLPDIPRRESNVLVVEKPENAHQTSIKIGGLVPGRNHPDYPYLTVLNTILGGFFGSRLMKSIREKRGMAYHIYSSVDTFWHAGYLFIGVETSPQNVKKVVRAIYAELDKLRQYPVSSRELNLVKKYMAGAQLMLADGPFNQLGIAKIAALDEMDMNRYITWHEQIQAVTPQELQRVAQEHLNLEQFVEIHVGA